MSLMLLSRLKGAFTKAHEDAPWKSSYEARTSYGSTAGGASGKDQVLPTEVDEVLIWLSVGLLILGLVMVYSASIALGDAPRFAGMSPQFYLMRHLISLGVGALVALITFNVPMATWQKVAPYLFIVGLVLLVMVLIPHIGKRVNGSSRWLPMGPMNLQPSELMKLFILFYAADFTVRKQKYMHQLSKGFLPMALATLLAGVLLLLETDIGAFIVVVTIAMGVLFLGGVNARLFILLVIMLVVSVFLIAWLMPERRARMFAYLDPWAEGNELGKAYQLTHSLIAFGRGSWLGVGLGASIEKLHYLPEAHTDFLLAVIGEELGLIGVLVVIFAFYALVKKAFDIGRKSIAMDRVFSGLVAQGIALWLGVQVLINMGVNLGILPTKGLTLPLMSYGGSGIIANCAALAVLLRIDWENRQWMKGKVS